MAIIYSIFCLNFEIKNDLDDKTRQQYKNTFTKTP